MYKQRTPSPLQVKDCGFIFLLTFFVMALLTRVCTHFFQFSMLDGPWMIAMMYVQDVLFLAIMCFFLFTLRRQNLEHIGLRLPSLKVVLKSIGFGIFLMAVMWATVQIMDSLLPNGIPAQNVEAIMNLDFPPLLFGLSVAATTLMAPIVEELLFRGYFFMAMQSRWGVGAGLVVANLCFALAHGDIYRFFPLFVGGLALNLWYLRENTLVASIVAHSVWNGMMSILFYLGQ